MRMSLEANPYQKVKRRRKEAEGKLLMDNMAP